MRAHPDSTEQDLGLGFFVLFCLFVIYFYFIYIFLRGGGSSRAHRMVFQDYICGFLLVENYETDSKREKKMNK